MKLRSLPSPRLRWRTVIPLDRTTQALFSATQPASASISEIGPRTGRTGGRAARGVSSWSLFCYLRFSVAAWRKEAPDGGDLGDFGPDARPRAHPAGQHSPCAEVRKAAGLIFSRLHFGDFAPRAWRVSAGRLENRGFFGIAPARLVLFLFRLLIPLSYAGPDPWNVLRGPFADSGFSFSTEKRWHAAAAPVTRSGQETTESAEWGGQIVLALRHTACARSSERRRRRSARVPVVRGGNGKR